jgi:hypothetical protein
MDLVNQRIDDIIDKWLEELKNHKYHLREPLSGLKINETCIKIKQIRMFLNDLRNLKRKTPIMWNDNIRSHG